MRTTILLATLLITLAACQPAQDAADGLNAGNPNIVCDHREITLQDGTPALKCDVFGGSSILIDTLSSAGFTVESDLSFDHATEYGMAFQAHTRRPTSAHLHVSIDSLNCFINGQGPYHCSSDNTHYVVPHADLDLDTARAILIK